MMGMGMQNMTGDEYQRLMNQYHSQLASHQAHQNNLFGSVGQQQAPPPKIEKTEQPKKENRKLLLLTGE